MNSTNFTIMKDDREQIAVIIPAYMNNASNPQIDYFEDIDLLYLRRGDNESVIVFNNLEKNIKQLLLKNKNLLVVEQMNNSIIREYQTPIKRYPTMMKVA